MQEALHLDETVLEQYAMNRLSEQEAELVEDHISLCGSCLNRLDGVVALVHDLKIVLEREQADGLAREKAARSRWDWLGWRTPVWAGAAFAMALLAFFVFRQEPAGNLTAVVLSGTRGASTAVHGSGPFEFEMFVPETAGSYRALLVDSEGSQVWTSVIAGAEAKEKDGMLHAKVGRKLKPGQYFLRVSNPSSQSTFEYGINIAAN